MITRIAAMAGVSLVVSACARITPMGDAMFVEPRTQIFGLAADSISFPKVNLAQTGKTLIRVRGVKGVEYPAYLEIRIPPRENLAGRYDQPWRQCSFTVSIVAVDGRAVLHTQHYDLGRYRSRFEKLYNSSLEQYIWLPFGKLPSDRLAAGEWRAKGDYDIVVTVHSASERKSDRLCFGSVSPIVARDNIEWTAPRLQD